ncbi:MAG TPA: hypothetical protein VE173_12350 [Longimicrobiales bacterium]|nr:hypothetical protein [Longimicrobiales bacterium]
MISFAGHPLQAAVEYGVANSSAATRFSGGAERLAHTARNAWHHLTADPILLVGICVVVVLLFLVLRNPAR